MPNVTPPTSQLALHLECGDQGKEGSEVKEGIFNTVIYCNVYTGWDFVPTACNGYLMKQDEFPDLKFYVTHNVALSGYALTEYETGFCISGDYPEKTPKAAEKWLQKRIAQFGKEDMYDKIKDRQQNSKRLNP